jgi:hypothetical protein
VCAFSVETAKNNSSFITEHELRGKEWQKKQLALR